MHSAGMVERVRQEVTIHSRLKHPSVLELYTFFEDANFVYLILEFAENGELRKYLKENRIVSLYVNAYKYTFDRKRCFQILSEHEAALILKQVVDGLVYLHSHNILHRDLSLSNLLLSKDLQIKIADFGLATQLSRPDEKHMTLCGTPNYISPEVASRASHGLPADVWGLGCMLYTFLVGRPPFDTDGVKSTLTRVCLADFELPSQLSAEARDLIGRLLRKNPAERMKLNDVLRHPFMAKVAMVSSNSSTNFHSGSTHSDSGMLTMSSAGYLSRSRPDDFRQDILAARPLERIQSYQEQPIVHQPAMGGVLQRFNSLDLDRKYGPPAPQFAQEREKSISLASLHQPQRFFGQNHTSTLSENESPLGFCPYNPKFTSTPDTYDTQVPEITLNYQKYGTGGVKFQALPPRRPVVVEEPKPERIGVPPFDTKRLLPTRHKAKSVILWITEGGEVVLEFFKYKAKTGEDRVMEVCRISSDGLRVVLYQPDRGR
jgi:polo-like kinase 4